MAEDSLHLMTGRSGFVVKADRLYSQDGVWVQFDPERGVARTGLTDYRQQISETVVFVELPERGMEIAAGEEMANVESITIDLSVAAPFAGLVVALNDALATCPELINQDPYGAGWLLDIRPGEWPAAGLLDDRAYTALTSAAAAEVRH